MTTSLLGVATIIGRDFLGVGKVIGSLQGEEHWTIGQIGRFGTQISLKMDQTRLKKDRCQIGCRDGCQVGCRNGNLPIITVDQVLMMPIVDAVCHVTMELMHHVQLVNNAIRTPKNVPSLSRMAGVAV